MKKFILGVMSTLGALGVGKIVYEKGRKDQAKDLKEGLDNISIGMTIGEKGVKKDDKES